MYTKIELNKKKVNWFGLFSFQVTGNSLSLVGRLTVCFFKWLIWVTENELIRKMLFLIELNCGTPHLKSWSRLAFYSTFWRCTWIFVFVHMINFLKTINIYDFQKIKSNIPLLALINVFTIFSKQNWKMRILSNLI